MLYIREIYGHEMDADGVCHHSNYFKIAEEALFKKIPAATLKENNMTFVVSKATATYIHPLYQGDKAFVEVATIKSTAVRISLQFSLKNESSKDIAHLDYEIVAVDQTTKTPMPMPTAIRNLLTKRES